MSRWSLYVCEDVSRDFTTMVLERYAGTFDTAEVAMQHARKYARPCRVREESSNVLLNSDGTKVAEPALVLPGVADSDSDNRTRRLLAALAEKRGAAIADLSAIVYDGDTSPKAQSNLRSLLAAQKRVKRVRAYARGKWEVIAE